MRLLYFSNFANSISAKILSVFLTTVRRSHGLSVHRGHWLEVGARRPPKLLVYSLFRLVWPNTEEPYSRPFLGLSKIRLVLQDHMSPKYLRKNFALFQLLLHLQLQQNTMVFIDVDGQICHFCSQGFVLWQILSVLKRRNPFENPTINTIGTTRFAEVVNEVIAGTTPNFF